MKKISCLILLVMLNPGCLADRQEEADMNELSGFWEIKEAYRDGKSTHTLDKGFFHFLNDSILVTNILQDTTPYNYQREKRQILVDDPLENRFTVIKLINDTLILDTRIQKFEFRLVSVKNPAYEPG